MFRFTIIFAILFIMVSCSGGKQKFDSPSTDTVMTDSPITCDTIYLNGQMALKKGAWTFCEMEDPMTDAITPMATNESENLESVSWGRTHLYLGLTYINGTSMIGLMLRQGCFETQNLPQIYVRFDKGQIETYSVAPDTNQSIYVVNYEKFMNSLKAAKRIAIQVEDQSRRKITFTFSNEGFCWNYPQKQI